MPSRKLNLFLWTGVLLLVVIMTVVVSRRFETYFAAIGTLDVATRENGSVVKMRWTGQIEAPMASRITEAYQQHKDKARTFVLALSSPGGSLDQGAAVVQVLKTIAATHHIETVVESGAICASMCVPVYLQGQERSAAADARFMFHKVSFNEFLSGEENAVPEAAKTRETDRLFARYFRAAGVSQEWIARTRSAMADGAEVWKTAQQLVDERASIVQSVFSKSPR